MNCKGDGSEDVCDVYRECVPVFAYAGDEMISDNLIVQSR